MAPFGPAAEMVSKLISLSWPDSRRQSSSLTAAAISSILRESPTSSIQARNRAMATPSRKCAARAPLISAAFLMALGRTQGSAPGTNLVPSAWSAWAKRIGAVSGSSRTRALDCASAVSLAISVAGSAMSRNSLRLPRTLPPTLAASMNRVGRPFAGTMAKASATGVWRMSPPRMLNSQAMESSMVRSTASAFSSRSSVCTSRILSCALRPANSRPWGTMGAEEGFGRSCHKASIGLAATGSSLMPALPKVSVRRSTSLIVCSEGS